MCSSDLAPWIDAQKLAEALNGLEIPGVRAQANSFEPAASYYAGQSVNGVRFVVTDRNVFDSSLLGLSLMEVLTRLYPKQINLEANLKLIGSPETIRRLAAGETAVQVRQSWVKALDLFSEKRQQYLIYP